ncbi:hypothetical protein YPPY13_2786, partial [Yersinia pestis PY-13]
MATTCIAFFS